MTHTLAIIAIATVWAIGGGALTWLVTIPLHRRSLGGLLGPLSPVTLGPAPGQPGPPPWLDCDTEDDVRRARAWSGDPAGPGPDVPR